MHLLEQGRSTRQAADECGVPRTTLLRHRKKLLDVSVGDQEGFKHRTEEILGVHQDIALMAAENTRQSVADGKPAVQMATTGGISFDKIAPRGGGGTGDGEMFMRIMERLGKVVPENGGSAQVTFRIARLPWQGDEIDVTPDPE